MASGSLLLELFRARGICKTNFKKRKESASASSANTDRGERATSSSLLIIQRKWKGVERERERERENHIFLSRRKLGEESRVCCLHFICVTERVN